MNRQRSHATGHARGYAKGYAKNHAPRATYRLQLNAGFTFADAQAQLPYLAALGISHLYLSPIMTARKGSNHGYDVVDPATVNPALGGEMGLRELSAAARRHGMAIIVDIVPNHIAVGRDDNRLWLDVLEWGHHSRYANFFDIDWESPDAALRQRVHAPFLGKSYGEALDDGEIRLHYDAGGGRFYIGYYDHRFPLAPTSYASLLRLGGEPLAVSAQQFRAAVTQPLGRRGEYFAEACNALAQRREASDETAKAIDQLLQLFDPQRPEGRNRLHQLLQRQHYRLASWRTAADEINWRRFFDVIELAAVRMEDPVAFEVFHATPLRLYAEGLIDGLRIDHIDGLADPHVYCRRLRNRLARLARLRPPEATPGAAYLIVEKILAPEERLPEEWRVDGTTGYSFMNNVSALLHDPAGETALAELWTALSGRSGDFDEEGRRARRRILEELLAAEFTACALALHRIARSDIRTRDWTLLAIQRVLKELLVQFPLYRTYADARGRRDADNDTMQAAIAAARPHCRATDAPLLTLIDNWLGAEPPRDASGRSGYRARLRAIARFQQLSSPLAAKSIEDTAFYRHGHLLSRNEVGANPAQFAIAPEEFHAECQRRAAAYPRALLATATHDHKRGEDLRARLATLSEQPSLWATTVQRWMQLNAHHKQVNVQWPVAGDEYMLYQMLAGGWPLDLDPSHDARLEMLCNRLQQWWTKALREAKQLSSWSAPNLAYEEACMAFVARLLSPRLSREFLTEAMQFVDRIAPAGVLNSLSQTLLKLTTPGVPDIYQGRELWDFSFVDPDNRQPVDFAHCRALLQAHGSTEGSEKQMTRLLNEWRCGAVKQQLIARLLAARRQWPQLFSRGDYEALPVSGALQQHLFCFVRRWRNQQLIVATPRLVARLVDDRPVVSASHWGDTRVALPDADGARWRNLITGELVELAELSPSNAPNAAALFSRFPCAVLWREE